jgi:hypothetical protein
LSGGRAACLAALCFCIAAQAQSCPPASHSRARLLELKAGGFQLEDAAERQALAIGLLACLEDPDPALRDGVAFEALSTWMRAGLLDAATASAVVTRLLPRIAPDYPDPAGFSRPFAALVLSEAARMDRVEPYLDATTLHALAAAAPQYLESVRDYRGFDEREGWRHGVAHGADLILQLSINPRVGKVDLDRFLAAIRRQVAPAGDHFYIFGEGERLARAVFYLAGRKEHTPEEWRSWFEGVSAPAPLAAWSEAFQSRAGLAKRQNTRAFLQALYLYVGENGDPIRERVLPPLVAALKQLP